VLRFDWLCAPGAAHSEEFLARKRGIAFMIGPPHTYLSSTHVADCGRAVASALQVPTGRHNIVDDEPLTKREYADALARAAGHKHYVRAPGSLALIMGDNITLLTRSLRVSNARFQLLNGWVPQFPSAREGLAATNE